MIAALDLTWLGQHLQQIQRGNPAFLAGGTLSVTDSDGVVLGRLTQHSEFVGRRIPAAAMEMVHAQHPGILQVRGVDGISRVFGYVPPSAATNNVMSAVGFEESDLMADINSALWQGAALLVGVTLIVVTLTWFAARRFIGRPTQALVAVARRWREGHLWARAPHQDKSSEFGQIAAAWNEMAAALQMRQDQLQEYSELLETRVAELGADQGTAQALATGAGQPVAGGTRVVVAAHGEVLLARWLPPGTGAEFGAGRPAAAPA